MLIEISCPNFITEKHPTGKVFFHPGLNVVLGSKYGANSIGKSTMLLIIDFAFGGSSYLESDAIKELGNHEISFTFRFMNHDFRFSRSTENPDIIHCHKSNGHIQNVSKDEYTQWLCHNYKMDYPGVAFRNTISRFFIIYKKSKINEIRPLNIRESESNAEAINVLLCLFNHHEEIKPYQERLTDAKSQYTAFKSAQKYKFISSKITKATDYNIAQSGLAKLRQEKENLTASNNSVVDTAEVLKANQTNELRRQLRDTRKKLEQKRLTSILLI